MKKYFLVLICVLLITLISAGLRYYKLGQAPAGLYIDEAGQGYSAYSILMTGKDEFGKSWPIVFRSFTDFKTPVYVYLIVPLIPFLGLTEFTVRFPSFFFSVLTFPVLFLLIKTIAADFKYRLSVSLMSCLLLAISPWHILFGRTDFECNVALFFYLLGIYLFYVGFKIPWLLTVSAIIFAISLPAYHSERIITPLTVLFLLIRHFNILKQRQYIWPMVIGCLMAIIITLPTLSVITTPGFLARASGLNIFSHQRQLPAGTIENYHGSLSWLVNSSWFLSTKEFFALYFAYFSPRYMFDLGDYEPRSSFPDLATFFVWQLPFYLAGLYILIKKRQELGELGKLTLFLLMISPLPAAVTRDPYTSIRALPMVIPQTIAISLGIIFFLYYLKNKIRLVGYLGLVGLVIYSVLQLYSSVIILNEYYRGQEWDYGLKEVSVFLEDKYQTIPVVFDNSRDESYIQVAFYLKYDPERYIRENFEVPPADYYINMNRVKEKKIGQLVTRPINWEIDLKKDQYLIGDELAISYDQIKTHHLVLEKEILYPDQSVAFRIVRTNPQYELNK